MAGFSTFVQCMVNQAISQQKGYCHLYHTTHLFAFFHCLNTPRHTGEKGTFRVLKQTRDGTANENVKRPYLSMGLVVVSAALSVDDT